MAVRALALALLLAPSAALLPTTIYGGTRSVARRSCAPTSVRASDGEPAAAPVTPTEKGYFDKIVVASGTTLFGCSAGAALIREWLDAGVDVTLLTRRPTVAGAPNPISDSFGHLGEALAARPNLTMRAWDGGVAGGDSGKACGWQDVLAGADAVVHISREASPAAEGGVTGLADAIVRCAPGARPKCFLTLSPTDGVCSPRDGFQGKRKARLAAAEAAAAAALAAGAPEVSYAPLRAAGVVGAGWYGGAHNGFLAGKAPWVHREDLAAAVARAAAGGLGTSSPLVIGLDGHELNADAADAVAGAEKLAAANFEFQWRDLEAAKESVRLKIGTARD